ncbi:MAG: thioredoxin domain-containing protein, partial [Fuerstia sp.]|nr:thioredoxin domain-containing protein [Fuerstiella sp.]
MSSRRLAVTATAAILLGSFSSLGDSLPGVANAVQAVLADESSSTTPVTTEESVTNASDQGDSGKAKKATESGPANRLARESSPYLLMHAHNPVDWYPWGPEAFEKARTENKPVFLSVGYSSCYWCHVMERQVFANQKIADYMKEHFVCIKVDREERPDVDDIYMTSLIVYQQATGAGGGGGWPLSMFLTPDGDPIAGATYLPPEDSPDGRTGFLTVATRVTELWTDKKEAVTGSAAMIAREVRRLSGPMVLAEPKDLTRELLETVVTGIEGRYDPDFGGVDFNERRPDGPRFPNVPRLQFLLGLHHENPRPELLKIVDHSLTAMAKGGIRDHLGGGFHRYSTDRRWNVPHFEKML